MTSKEYINYLMEELNWPKDIAANYVQWLIDYGYFKEGGKENE